MVVLDVLVTAFGRLCHHSKSGAPPAGSNANSTTTSRRNGEASGNKTAPNGDQIDFYDRPAQVDRSVGAIDAWFKMHLANSAREPGMA
jgi:hypothetical protein